MRVEAWLFTIVAVFLYVVAGVYAYGTWAATHLEWTGTVALALAGTLSLVCATYFGFVARRIQPRPEDHDGEISDRAGPMGFFAPHSYWPVGVAVCITVGAAGIALHQGWLLILGVLGAVVTAAALSFEFYLRTARSGDRRQG